MMFCEVDRGAAPEQRGKGTLLIISDACYSGMWPRWFVSFMAQVRGVGGKNSKKVK